jgi:hypothetical protein
MKKIVYNACYGGFGLSPLGLTEYAKRKGITLYWFNDKYELVNTPDKYIYSINPYTKDISNSHKDKEKNRFFYYPDIPRDDVDLVAVVEELGEKANGFCAKLAITEIEGKWRIDEYDGAESVETPDSYDWNN